MYFAPAKPEISVRRFRQQKNSVVKAIEYSTMARDNVCAKCSLSIDHKADRFIFCEGYCSNFYHCHCVNLSEREVTVLSTNYIWLCDECLDLFQRMRDERDKGENMGPATSHAAVNCPVDERSMKAEINELKDAVADIMKTLARLGPTETTVDRPLLHSTPVSTSLSLQDGTSTSGVILNNGESSKQGTIDDRFSLFLTNIDASTTEDDIHRLVARALGTGSQYPECIDVVKLMSHLRNCRTIDYVSFKVILDNRWKSKAMSPSTWPKGIRFREFVNRHSVTWKPVE